MIDEKKLVDLLKKNLERMKLINGADERCILGTNVCPNHRLIHETEEALRA